MSRVAERFGRAAATYAGATPIQRQVAAALADGIAAAVAPGARVAEFGAGVGYLPAAAWNRVAPRLWLATDIAPAMAAQLSLPPQGVAAVMDAHRPALAPGFDLVCSSLTLQWLDDPAAVIARWRALLRPGGVLAVSTLADGSFAEWRAALRQAGVAEPGPRFAALEVVKGWFGPGAEVRPLTLVETHGSALDFARAARRAGIDAGFGRPLDAGTMRRALGALDRAGPATTYAAVTVIERL